MAIGVAVGDSPVGPFKDAIGKPLHDGSWDYIDPTVFIDDDGRAYLYWGNPNIYYAELNEDMISLKGGVGKLEQTVESLVHLIRKSVSKVLSIKILIQKVHGFINGKENTIFFMLLEVSPNILPIP